MPEYREERGRTPFTRHNQESYQRRGWNNQNNGDDRVHSRQQQPWSGGRQPWTNGHQRFNRYGSNNSNNRSTSNNRRSYSNQRRHSNQRNNSNNNQAKSFSSYRNNSYNRNNNYTRNHTHNNRDNGNNWNFRNNSNNRNNNYRRYDNNRQNNTQYKTRMQQQQEQPRRNVTFDHDITSKNPDFQNLFKLLFRSAQLKYHMTNWGTLPPSLQRNLLAFADDITPPDTTDELRKDLQRILTTTGEQLQHRVLQHLNDRIETTDRHLAELDPTDKNRAIDIAQKHLRKGIGRRIPDLQEQLEQTASKIGRNRRHQTEQPARWNTPNKTSKKRKPNDTPSPPRNRFDGLHVEDMEEETTEQAGSPQTYAEIIRPSPVAGPSTRSDNTQAPTSSAPLPQRRPRRITIHTDKRLVLVDKLTNSTHLLIGDSNLSNTKEEDIPDGWQVEAIPGAHIHNITQAISTLPNNLANCTVIMACGINHRDKGINETIMEANTLSDLCRSKSINFAVTGIPINPQLSDWCIRQLSEINEVLEKTFPLTYLQPIATTEVQTRKNDAIHYDDCTRRKVLVSIASALDKINSKN